MKTLMVVGVFLLSLAAQAADFPELPKYTLSVKDFGAKGNGRTDDTAAIRKALAYQRSKNLDGFVRIHFPQGTYLVTDTIRVTHGRTYLEGEGKYVTTIKFRPSRAEQAVFLFYSGNPDDSAGVLYQVGISRMGILPSNGKLQTPATAISSRNTSQMEIRDIAILKWRDEKRASTGVLIRGREIGSVSNLSIGADNPIIIRKLSEKSGIDIDHFHFENLLLYPSPGSASVFIAAGVNLSNVTFDGFQAWVGGKYGLLWFDNKSTQPSINLVLKNIRWENGNTDDPEDYSAFGVFIRHNYVLNNLRIENLRCGGFKKAGTKLEGKGHGILLRKTFGASLSNIYYAGALQGLSLDPSVKNVHIDTTFFGAGSSVSLGGAAMVSGNYLHGSNYVTLSKECGR